MTTLQRIQVLKEKVICVDMFIRAYKTRITDLKKDREQYMQEITELRVTPIIEA